LAAPFAFDEASRQRLLEGKDEIDLILANESDISAFEAQQNTLEE
jgi:3-isopropylmalate dehydratase small subunit